jgi:hypothetical protein
MLAAVGEPEVTGIDVLTLGEHRCSLAGSESGNLSMVVSLELRVVLRLNKAEHGHIAAADEIQWSVDHGDVAVEAQVLSQAPFSLPHPPL